MKNLLFLTASLVVLSSLVLPSLALAQQDPVGVLKQGLDTSAGRADIPVVAEPLPNLIGRVINSLFALIGSIFLIFTIIGGILWMMAGGAEEKVTRAKGFITGGIKGLVIIFMAYGLVYVVLRALDLGAAGGSQ